MAAYKCGKSDHICYSWGKEIRYDFHGVVYCYMLCCVVLDGRCKSIGMNVGYGIWSLLSGPYAVSMSIFLIDTFQRKFNYRTSRTRFFSKSAYMVYLFHPWVLVSLTFAYNYFLKHGCGVIVEFGKSFIFFDYKNPIQIHLDWFRHCRFDDTTCCLAIEFLSTKVARVEASDVIVVATKAYVYGFLFTSTPSNIHVDDAEANTRNIYLNIFNFKKDNNFAEKKILFLH